MSRARKVGKNTVQIECPGCDCIHSVGLETWTWNGDTQLPTLSPSLLVTVTYGTDKKKKFICHSFVENGQIRYLDDTTHQFKGQTLDLPEL